MAFYRRLVAHCDGHQPHTNSGCYSSQVLNPETTQPYHDLMEAGWSLGPDGVSIYCPKTHKEDA
jgi:hypothetical protein